MPWPLQLRRFSNRLQRTFGLQGHLPLTLLDDVSPVVELEPSAAELQAPTGVRLCAGYRVQGAVAAQFSKVILSNPAGSGVVCIPKRISMNIPASGVRASLYGPEQAITGGATAGQQVTFLDTRLGQVLDRASFNPPVPACTVRGISEAAPDMSASSTVFDQWQNSVMDRAEHYYDDLVLMPGDQVLLQALAVNQGFTGFFTWRERPLAPQENVAG